MGIRKKKKLRKMLFGLKFSNKLYPHLSLIQPCDRQL